MNNRQEKQWELVAQFVKIFLEVGQFIALAEKDSSDESFQANPDFILRCNLIGEVFVLERIRRLFEAIESLTANEKLVVDEKLKRKVIHEHLAMFVCAILPDLDKKEVEKSITDRMEAMFARSEPYNDFNNN